jgi:hypothetical protein
MYNYDAYQVDPVHLNDIQPVLRDGPLWRRNDLFLSVGHLNMLLLWRPTAAGGQLLWWTQERIMHQHDVDVVDAHTIAVYDNRRTTRAAGDLVIGHNELLLLELTAGAAGAADPAGAARAPLRTAAVRSYRPDALRAHDVRTVTQGLAELGADGSLMIEETMYGRLLKLGADGGLDWEYVNKDSRGATWTLNWTRYLPAAAGERIVGALAATVCDAQR